MIVTIAYIVSVLIVSVNVFNIGETAKPLIKKITALFSSSITEIKSDFVNKSEMIFINEPAFLVDKIIKVEYKNNVIKMIDVQTAIETVVGPESKYTKTTINITIELISCVNAPAARITSFNSYRCKFTITNISLII